MSSLSINPSLGNTAQPTTNSRELIEAVDSEDHKRVISLLENGANPNTLDSKGTPVLVTATKCAKILNTLLIFGADPNIVSKFRGAALHCSAFGVCINSANRQITNTLLLYNANPNLPDKNGKTPVHFAALSDDLETVQMLLRSEGSLNIQSSNGETPLLGAIMRKCQNVITPLLESQADPNLSSTSTTTLAQAIFQDDLNLVGTLLDHNADPNLLDKCKFSALHSAAKYGNKQIAELLLDRNADPNSTNTFGQTPLYYAAQHGWNKQKWQARQKVGRLLVSRGAKIDPTYHLYKSDQDSDPQHKTQSLNYLNTLQEKQ